MNHRKICLCSSALPREMTESLSERYHIIPLPPDELLDKPVQTHPDMLCTVMDDCIFFPKAYAEAHSAVIHEIVNLSGMNLILTDAPRSSRYPEDVGLNVTVLPDAILCRKQSTAPEILASAERTGRTILSVRQGYAGCSCIHAGNAVLTSDMGIHKTLVKHGMDSTFIENRGILLPGYDVGFIGGCGGADDGTLFLFGSPDSIAEAEVIRDFAAKHNLTVFSLSENNLTDYGGLKIL